VCSSAVEECGCVFEVISGIGDGVDEWTDQAAAPLV
jgi:hypothetical protein